MDIEPFSTNQINILSIGSDAPTNWGDFWTEYTQGILVMWDIHIQGQVAFYQILKSPSLQGPFEVVATVPWPNYQWTDNCGKPTNYYRIRTINNDLSEGQITGPIVGEELLIKQSLYFGVKRFMDIEVKRETPMFNQDRTEAKLAYKNWNISPTPQVRMPNPVVDGNGLPYQILSDTQSIRTTVSIGNNYPSGLKIKYDWNGRIFFVNDLDSPQSVFSYDEVDVTYHMKMFTVREMNQMLYMALQSINALPGTNKYSSVAGTPMYWESGLVSGAKYYLLSNLYNDLIHQEERLLLIKPDGNLSEIMDSMKEAKEDFENEKKNIPIAKYPGSRTITTPETSFPGGRSRMFREEWGHN